MTSSPAWEKSVEVDGREVTRHTLLQNSLKALLDIEGIFNDADYWNRNTRQADEEKINPDPNAELARNWLRIADDLTPLLNRMKPAFEKHVENYGGENVVEFKKQ